MSTPDAAAPPPPPPGFPALVSNPDDNAGPNIFGATLACTILAFMIFSGRFYVRAFMVKALGWDDYFMALAMAVVSTTRRVLKHNEFAETSAVHHYVSNNNALR